MTIMKNSIFVIKNKASGKSNFPKKTKHKTEPNLSKRLTQMPKNRVRKENKQTIVFPILYSLFANWIHEYNEKTSYKWARLTKESLSGSWPVTVSTHSFIILRKPFFS